jgi:hypothetical protein
MWFQPEVVVLLLLKFRRRVGLGLRVCTSKP